MKRTAGYHLDTKFVKRRIWSRESADI